MRVSIWFHFNEGTNSKEACKMTSSPSTDPPQKFNLQDPATQNLPSNIGNKYMTKTKEVGRLTRKFEEGIGSDPSVERIKGDLVPFPSFKPFLKTSLEGLGSSSKKVLGKRNMVHEDEENKIELVQKNAIEDNDNQEDGNQENENNGDDRIQVNENNGDDGNQEDDNGEDENEEEEEDENGDDEEVGEEVWYNFLVNVYERMPDDRERYQQLLRYFDNFGSGLMTLRQLRLLVEDAIGNFEDLMEVFKSAFVHYYGEDYQNIEDYYYESEKVGMFKVEHQKFERHMLLQWLRSSCEYLREIQETGGFDERFGTIKKIVFRRCVERMWGDYADDVLDMFYSNCQGVAQIILDRMEQKAEELRQSRNLLKANVWRCQRM